MLTSSQPKTREFSYMAGEPEEKCSQQHSLEGTCNPQLLPPIVQPVPRIIAPLVVESNNPKFSFRIRLAFVSAVLIDCIQLGFFPLFAPGFLSIADDLLDCIAFLWFWRLIGWHWALLPGFVFKLAPFVDLAPTWTLAVWIAARNKHSSQNLRTVSCDSA